MRDPLVVLNNLASKSHLEEYVYFKIYRNLYNRNFYLVAYSKLAPNGGNLTEGVNGTTIDGMSIQRIDDLIEQIKNESYKPQPVRRTYIPKKNGKLRPLGIPSFNDKLVQEVVRMILEAIYENSFSDHSHGFRPNRSCHTALMEIKRNFTGVKWFIEGDIEGFFDNINHQKLISILRKRIKDEKFINLIWKFLKAGYMEDWKFHKTYSGTPQGGIISPILSNIYLNELDNFVENYKFDNFTEGKKRKRNPEYKLISGRIEYKVKKLKDNYETLDESERRQLQDEINELRNTLRSMQYSDPMDGNDKRLLYVRYADDFLIGIIGSKKDASHIKEILSEFLKDELKLNLSDDKTLITNGKDFARFLSYDITIENSHERIRDKNGNLRRFFNGRCQLYVPREKWINTLLDLGALKIDRTGKWKWLHRPELINRDDLEILSTYNSEIRGFYIYYRLAKNASVVGKFYSLMKHSMFKTFANKYKTSTAKIIRKYSVNGTFMVKYETKSGTKYRKLYDEGFKRNESVIKNIDVDHLPNTF
ncbi:group II intron reverse transcriptase/maturase [Oikeobacillus pervagus]|uniref:Group II intron reverse transcriptase/maturase n=1 Tax=Oikeobacillus pervagus TaxID=1325931 RepID=A0AAJ1SXS5_9BACI|nr:group II intron reverse transcriptase/maturase [Oikeobacillus pervagus]